LEPVVARLPPEGAPAAGAAAPPPIKAQTRLMVESSTPGAMVSLDSEKPGPAPFISEVKPGKHHVVVTSDGYFDGERDVSAIEGEIIPVDMTLKERPAKLTVEGTSGAQISVDGRFTGTVPQQAPIELTSGRHLVTVTKSGYKAFSQELDFTRG